MSTLEILRARTQSPNGEQMLRALAVAAISAGDQVSETQSYQGRSDWLALFGVGAKVNDDARRKQVEIGRNALLFDLGYFGRAKMTGYLRISINNDHPDKHLIDRTEPAMNRWAKHVINLREDANPKGPVLLIGLGRKSRLYLNESDWERQAYERLRKRFPDRAIVFRPKGNDAMRLPCRTDATTRIEELLRGASLVVCRHSNCAVDATIAGVPFEAENGAAMWLQAREFTPANRLEFLRRLAWWQWKSGEAAEAWAFAKQVVAL